MALNYDHLMGMQCPPQRFDYTESDTILYALGVGMGRQPDELRYVYERDLMALPTLATVIAWDDSWQIEAGLTVEQIVHGEMRVTLHRPLPPRGAVVSELRIIDAFDKGAGRGAILLVETVLRDASDGQPVATLVSTVFARGDGGFGGPAGRGPEPHVLPTRPADMQVPFETRPEQALIYRLSGDRNPLHADPPTARAAGFDRPILHGLCSYGIALASIVRSVCPDGADRITHFEARFTAPVYPGETLVTEIWRGSEGASFRCHVAERSVIALDHGFAKIASRKE